ncbi:MAG: hypothetical protein K2X47_19385 [Bdellovibrionales bacterium]|nr:hypothetical protein [Bdellovibrionales bacterium]
MTQPEFIQLGDYFYRLDFIRIMQILLGVAVLDTIGIFIRKRLLDLLDDSFGPLDWILGYVSLTLPTFLLGLFSLPSGNVFLVAILVISIACIHFRKTLPNFGFSKENILIFGAVLIIFSPLFEPLFIKASLPPNFSDEMSYHFWTPRALNDVHGWWPARDLFNMIPRTLDVLHVITFSVTKSFVMARAFNVFILFSMCTFIWRTLKELGLGKVGLLFPLAFCGLTLSLPLWITSGFVDIPTAIVGCGAAPLIVRFLQEKKQEFLVGAWLLFSISIGMKYSGLNGFVSLTFASLALLLALKQGRTFFPLIQTFLKTPKIYLSFLWFGGFWYLKNLIITGNPIYPFVLPCYRWAEDCRAANQVFGTWTLKVNLENAGTILNQLFYDRYMLFAPFFFSVGLSLFSKKTRILGLLIGSAFLIELLILKFSSGFYLRYQQLFVLYICLFFCLGAGFVIERFGKNLGYIYIVFISVLIVEYGYSPHITHAKSLEAMPQFERDFAAGRTNVLDFAKSRFPGIQPFFEFCANPPDSKVVDVHRFDPELIWFTEEAHAHHFFSNCRIIEFFIDAEKFLPVEDPENSRLLEREFAKKGPSILFFSTSPCLRGPIPKKYPSENSMHTGLRQIDNWLVCRSKLKYGNLLYEYTSPAN